MGESAETLAARVRSARAAVVDAVAAHNSSAVSAAMDELEDALRVARKNGIDVPQDSGAWGGVRDGRERG